MYAGSVLVSAVDEHGNYSVNRLEVGDIWYFPKGVAHTIQGLQDENEFLLVFDDGSYQLSPDTIPKIHPYNLNRQFRSNRRNLQRRRLDHPHAQSNSRAELRRQRVRLQQRPEPIPQYPERHRLKDQRHRTRVRTLRQEFVHLPPLAGRHYQCTRRSRQCQYRRQPQLSCIKDDCRDDCLACTRRIARTALAPKCKYFLPPQQII